MTLTTGGALVSSPHTLGAGGSAIRTHEASGWLQQITATFLKNVVKFTCFDVRHVFIEDF